MINSIFIKTCTISLFSLPSIVYSAQIASLYIPGVNAEAEINYSGLATRDLELLINGNQWVIAKVVAINNTGSCPMTQTYRATGTYVAVTTKVNLSPTVQATLRLLSDGNNNITETRGYSVSTTFAGVPASGLKPCDQLGGITQYGTQLPATKILLSLPDDIPPGKYSGAFTGSFASSIINANPSPVHFTIDNFLDVAANNLRIKYNIEITNFCRTSTQNVVIDHGTISKNSITGLQKSNSLSVLCTNDTPINLTLKSLSPPYFTSNDNQGVGVGLAQGIDSKVSLNQNGVSYQKLTSSVQANIPFDINIVSKLHANSPTSVTGLITGNAILEIFYN